jgi:RNA polymerase sigma factor (sigma-70 family)
VSGLDDPPSYVRKMVTNEYLSWRRKWSRVVPFADPAIFQRPPDRPDDATTLVDRDDLVSRLATLTRRQRVVLALRFFDGLSDAEIASTLGCGEGSVRTHASRGLAALRIEAAQPATAKGIPAQTSKERP